MTDEHDIIRVRRDKLARWRETGRAYPNAFRRDAMAAELHERCADQDKAALESAGIEAAVAGRVMLRRVMGKASFITLQDDSGRIQCYVRKDDVGDEAYQAFDDLWDIGDIVGVRGTLMRTNKGELTVQASHIELLSKDLRPLPEKYHGLSDHEIKYRQRYLDLIMNPDSRRVFEVRSRVVAYIRAFFNERGFMEVETPMMQLIPGGAAARPFVTHHNALDLELYLRVAPELYLKRLTVGGFERVFEVNRNFRNEGLSTRHNPEFTMLEFYQAYSDYRDLMDFSAELLKTSAEAVLDGETTATFKEQSIDFSNLERLTLREAICEHWPHGDPRPILADLDDPGKVRELIDRHNQTADSAINVDDSTPLGKALQILFEETCEERLVQPTLIYEYPVEASPLSKQMPDDPNWVERFEIYAAGMEIANAYSELNDPQEQRRRFESQVAMRAEGDGEAHGMDEDYLRALSYGMPPTAGEGVGIDRLCMLLTDSHTIRDVILFPLLRPEGEIGIADRLRSLE